MGRWEGMAARPIRTILSVIGLVAAMLVGPGIAPGGEREEAAAFLSALSQQAIQKLTDAAASDKEKEQRFRELMESSFDLPRIGKFVLGNNWRQASPEQQENFIEVFKSVQVKRFLPMFAEYSGEKLLVTKVRQDQSRPELFFVASIIRRPQGEPYFVEWRLHRHADRYKILDVATEGVSMAVTLRNEYSSVAMQHGIDGLIFRLREKVGQNAAGATAADKQE